MKEASFYKLVNQEDMVLQCNLCNHRCILKSGRFGLCKVRQNCNGKLISHVYGKLVSENSDPIEKKPLFHVLPGSRSYSISTVGCNFTCRHCQNHQISQYPRHNPDQFPGTTRTPQQVVNSAQQTNCQSISYTYVEPTIFFEFAYDTAKKATNEGIKNVFVSNGYTSQEAVRKISPYLDANNIDLKSFSEKFYSDICGAKLSHVLDTIQLYKELNVWVEVTTLIIPGLNDTKQELENIANFLVRTDVGIPWHVSRFHPTYNMTDRLPTPPESLLKARDIGLNAGLKYVYTGNIPGQGGENTICPGCGKVVIERLSYTVINNHIKNNNCKFCSSPIAGVFE